MRRAEATEQFPWGQGGAAARGSPASSELGTEWTLGIGDSRHLLRPEEHHSFLFMFIRGRNAVVPISDWRDHKCSMFPPLKGRC